MNFSGLVRHEQHLPHFLHLPKAKLLNWHVASLSVKSINYLKLFTHGIVWSRLGQELAVSASSLAMSTGIIVGESYWGHHMSAIKVNSSAFKRCASRLAAMPTVFSHGHTMRPPSFNSRSLKFGVPVTFSASPSRDMALY